MELKLTLISCNGQWAFVWMPDAKSGGRYGYGVDGRCTYPARWRMSLFGIGRGECVYE